MQGHPPRRYGILSAVPNLLTFPIRALLLFALPGYLMTRLIWPRADGLLRLAVSLMTGGMLVGWLVLGFVQSTGLHCSLWVLVGLSGAASAVLLGLCHWRGRPIRMRLSPADWRVIGIGLAVWTLWLWQYDRDLFQFNCVNEAARLVLGGGERGVADATKADYVLAGNSNVRLGSVALVAPAFIAFDFFGARLLFATTGLLLFWFGALVGRRLFSHEGWAVTTGLMLAANPYVLAIPLVDENVLAYLAGLAILYCALDEDSPLAWLGVVVGYMIGIRHLMLLAVGAPALIAWRRRAPRRDIVAGLAALVAVGLLWATHHQIVFGSVLSFESFQEYPLQQSHTFLGMPFTFNGLLNAPFHDAIVRTPYNPFPNFVMMPLWVGSRLGVLLTGLGLLGLGWLHRSSRLDARLIAAFCVPTLLVLAPLENWMQPNKMGIQLIVLSPLFVGVVAGLRAVALEPKRASMWAAALVVTVAIGQAAVAGWEVQPDERTHGIAQFRRERPEYFRWERDHLVRHNILPDYGRIGEYSDIDAGRKWSDVFFDLNHSDTITPPSRPRLSRDASHPMTFVRVDLSRPLIGRTDWVLPTEPSSTMVSMDPATATEAVRLVLPDVSWSELSPRVALAPMRDRDALHLIVEFGEAALIDDYSGAFSPHPLTLEKPSFVVAVPRGVTLIVTEVVADNFSKYYRWRIKTDPLAVPKVPMAVFTN